jgi:hypothetical protein
MLLNAVIAVLALAAIPLAILLALAVNWFVKNRCQSGNKGCRVCRLKCEKKDDNDDNDNNSGGLAALSF